MNQENIYQGAPAHSQNAGSSYAPGPPSASQDRFTPLYLVRVVLQGWRLVVLAMLVGCIAGLLYIQFATPIYMAAADMEMSIRQPKVINNEAVFDDSNWVRDEGAIFYTRFAKFKSPAMERLATEEYFKLYPDDESFDSAEGISRYLLSKLIREVAWSKDPKANIVTVAFSGPNPEFAAKLVNVMTRCAGLLMMQENKTQSDEAVRWLVTQVDEKRTSLEDIERKLSDLRSELHLDSLQQRKAVLDQSMTAVSVEREGIISMLASRKTVYDFVKKLKSPDLNLEVLPPGLPKEEELNNLMEAWRTAREELLLVAGRYTERHPEYRRAAEVEERARGKLDQFIDLSTMAVENEIELLAKQVDQIDARIDTIKTEAIELEKKIEAGNRQLQRLESERLAENTSYQSMLRRVEEARLSADENMAFTKVIKDAEIPKIPVRPKKPRVMVASAFLGGGFGSLIVILVAFMVDTIGSVSDLRSLGLNVLGIIPSQKKVFSRGELATIGLRDKFNRIVEVFAGINAVLMADKFISQTRMMVVCSVMPGEGKTICACNLALSSALNGAKTLLIDGDLRRPQVDNIFAINDEHPSLLEWLCNGDESISHEDLVVHDVVDHLDIISSRPFTEVNPAELLGRSQLSELLEWARNRYDRVIIDSPPMGPVGDAQVLANLADCVVMVIRIGKTRTRLLKFVLNRFRNIDVNVLGCIANDVPNSLAGMFGGAEGYGYGYGHGYGGYASSKR